MFRQKNCRIFSDMEDTVEKAGKNTIVVADGTSCRHQINDGTGHKPIHVARILEMALE